MNKNPLLIILGPTASGKTKLAANLANSLNGEIISADSRQVFKGMDIGTGKDLETYIVNGNKIKTYLIDIRLAGEKYHVNAFKEDFYNAFENITQLNKLPILCGGTGMYIHSILQNQPYTAIPINQSLRDQLIVLSKTELQEKLNTFPLESRENADFSSSKRLIRAIEIATYLQSHPLITIDRPTFTPLVIGLQNDVDTRRYKILARLEERLNNGLIEEVEHLLANGVSEDTLIFYGLEYKFVTAYLKGEIDYATLKERLGIAICQFAKRQMTFFRKMEKDGVKIHWLNADESFSSLQATAIQLFHNSYFKN